jgi:hypothetical protein
VSGGIYLLRGDDDLVAMQEQPYDSEALLQSLLAKHPSLLAGDQLPGSEPRRWLLVAREASLPSSEDGGGRWSVDHLFLDQDAVPTLVEVKRSSDTRIRREVVGQMLDYAANAVVYWPLERLRATFELRCQAEGLVADDAVHALLDDPDIEPDEFWQRVETNLKAGRVRLVFVADEIPPELRRIVEFLNEQMNPAEVLGIEVRQYVGGDDLRTLVPRVIGQTAEAQQRKGQTRRLVDPWTWERYAQALGESRLRTIEALRNGLNAAITSQGLPWEERLHTLHNGYIGYQRQGGYIAVSIVSRRTDPELAIKLPRAPVELGIENPFPDLREYWDEKRRQWVWIVPDAESVPDIGRAIAITARYQPTSGPMIDPS